MANLVRIGYAWSLGCVGDAVSLESTRATRSMPGSRSRSARRSASSYQRGGVEDRFALAVKGPVLVRMRRWTEGTAGYEIAPSFLFDDWFCGAIDNGRQIWARPGRPLQVGSTGTRGRSNKTGSLSRQEEMKCNEREV